MHLFGSLNFILSSHKWHNFLIIFNYKDDYVCLTHFMIGWYIKETSKCLSEENTNGFPLQLKKKEVVSFILSAIANNSHFEFNSLGKQC